jgi:hypothetical protein
MLRRVRGAHVAFAARLFAKFEAKYEPHLSVKGQATAPSSLSYTSHYCTIIPFASMLSPRLRWTPHAVLTVNYTHYVGPRCFRPRASPDIMPAERGRSAQREPTLRVFATEATSERSSHQRHFFWTTLELCCTFLVELTSYANGHR